MMNKQMISRTGLALLLIVFALIAMIVRPAQAIPNLEDTPVPTQMSDTTVSIQFSKASVNPGEEFDLTVRIKTDKETRGIQFEIEFDPTLIEMSEVFEEGSFYSDWAGQNGASTILLPQPVIDNVQGIVQLTGIAILGALEGTGGPSGDGVLLTLHGKAKDGANGTAQFRLDQVIVADAGDVQGTTSPLGGVKLQDGVIVVGDGQGAAAPEAREATAVGVQAAPTITQEPTIAKRTSLDQGGQASGGAIPWEIILPLGGAIIISLGAFIFLRKPKA